MCKIEKTLSDNSRNLHDHNRKVKPKSSPMQPVTSHHYRRLPRATNNNHLKYSTSTEKTQ